MLNASRVGRFVLLLLLALPGLAAALQDIREFNFTAGPSSATLPANTSTECSGTITAADQLDRLALVVLDSFNPPGVCYNNGGINNDIDFFTEKGTVAETGNPTSFDAYRIAPGTPATNFAASGTGVYYKFPAAVDYTVYKLDGTAVSKVLEIPAASIDINNFVKVTDGTTTLTVHDRTAPLTVFFAPSSQPLSAYHSLGTGVEGARIKTTALGDLNIYRYDVTGTPYDTRTGFSTGPSGGSNRYADKRQHFNVRKAGGGEHGVLWQDTATMALFITWSGAAHTAPSTVSVPNTLGEILVAATHDDAGNAYYLTIQAGDGAPNAERNATLYKVDSGGTLVIPSVSPDTSAGGLNMVEFFNGADMHYAGGRLGLFLARKMHQSGDGLNHQGGIAVVFDAATLLLVKNHGQTSGHSWDNFLTARPSGEFLGIDLGDNFPRGVNLHKFDDTQRQSRIAFGFKTLHGTTATSPDGATHPVYTEISGGGTTYYQWSNDNEVYSELAAVIESGSAFSLVFAAEPDATGKALDNARVGESLNDARDIALVRVRGDFENASGGGGEVSDDLVLSGGTPEVGGFYSFTGGWTPQRNAGVVWLTTYADKNTENASRVRAIDLADGNILVFWEKWTSTAYVSTHVMKVSPAGAVLQAAIDLGTVLRFDRRGDLWRDGNKVYSLAGSAGDKKLELFVLEPGTPGPACDGTNVTVGPITYTNGQVITCTGTVSLQTNGAVRIETGADVTYIAPTVTIKDGVSAEAGSTFTIKNNP